MALVRCGRYILGSRKLYTSSRLQQGYIVLVPEIGEDHPEKNPLYHQEGLPKFTQITIENCRAAIAKQTLDFELGVQSIEKNLEEKPYEDVFKEIIEPLERIGHPMECTWGLAKTLYFGNNSLMPTTSYMAIHDKARRARVTKFNSKRIYVAIKEELAKEKQYSTEQTRVLKKYAIEGKLNGLSCNQKQTNILSYNLGKLATEKDQFKFKNEMATKQHSQIVKDRAIVRDFPDWLLKATAVDTHSPMEGPWRFTLQPHIYDAIMEHCPDKDIRWNLWKAHVHRGAVSGEKDLATSLHVEEIRYMKNLVAKALGYKNYVEMSMETKMAGSKEEVNKMLDLLLERAKPAQDEEVQSLVEFANERGHKTESLNLWDIPYWRRKQRLSVYQINDNQLKEYFPLNTVLDGMFSLCEKLFNIVIKVRSGVTAWHKDVRYYDIFEPHSSAPVAGFYIDPYQRSDDKIRFANSGWMVGIHNKSQVTDVKPLAALIFNFEPPKGDRPSVLSFSEVKSLFQRFGHSLQHLLTRTHYSEVAGLSYVEWDAVEISGNVLLHWLNDRQVIQSITSHCDSGDQLPQPLYENLIASNRHMAGLDLSTELYLSALDLELYSTNSFWLDIVKDLWPKYRSFPLDRQNEHVCSFMPIFTGDWGAAYYSHVWSRMIAADVYSAFHEVRDDEQQVKDVGKRFRDTFLAKGGSEHPSQIFREFRGRDPSHKALLKSLGFKKFKQDS